MELTLWTYEGPPHVGAIRIAASMRGVHLVLHAPQGDTYADLLFTMIERDGKRPPVTYTTFQARDLGASTAEKFLNTLQAAYDHHKPSLILVADSCTRRTPPRSARYACGDFRAAGACCASRNGCLLPQRKLGRQ